jgi:outer membrane protein OmpA-like peptidoglycan-associated protein
MIRQKIEAAKVVAQAAEKEEGLKRVRENIDKTKKAIQQAMLQKAALEARNKCSSMKALNSFTRIPGVAPPALLLALTAALAACSTPPKPPELEAFEKLRSDPAADAAAKRNPDWSAAPTTCSQRAKDEWQSNDLEEARNSSLLGQIKLKHALALFEQERAPQAHGRGGRRDPERRGRIRRRLQKDLASLNEQVALLKRLGDAANERQKLAQQLTDEQKKANEERVKAGAADRMADAELAIKTAEDRQRRHHAKVPYSAAIDNLARARTEFQQSNFQAAQTSAEMAKLKATEATTAAKPIYEQEAQAAENKQRAEALARDSASIPNVIVRREARGSLQRLVIPLQAERLFVKRETTIAPGRDVVLDTISGVMKKYPAFPVQIVGYTDNRGRAGEQLALSLARAQSVFSALVLRGVEAKRMVVSGQGSAEPVSDNRNAAGRAQNNRIEIIFLYQ